MLVGCEKYRDEQLSVHELGHLQKIQSSVLEHARTINSGRITHEVGPFL